jgi:hypothetical protein
MSYQGSGDLAVPLVAGRFYAIGVTWSSPGIDIGYQMGTFPQTVSFGSFISSGFVSGGTPPASVPYSTPATYLVPQRLTTAP